MSTSEGRRPEEALAVWGQLIESLQAQVSPTRRFRAPTEDTTTLRKSVAAMTPAEIQAFTRAVERMRADNQRTSGAPWGKYVDFHQDVTNRIHGTLRSWPGRDLSRDDVALPPVSTDANSPWWALMQFLPWHRMFVVDFEQQLRSRGAPFCPYWDWTVTRALPSWLQALAPTITTPNGRTIAPGRRPTVAPASPSVFWQDPGASAGPRDDRRLPSAADIARLDTRTAYSTFTLELELQHNRPHGWVGTAMSDPATSPADVVFFMHHAQIDRLWLRWQRQREAQAVAASAAGGMTAGVTAAMLRGLATHPNPDMALDDNSMYTLPTARGRALTRVRDVIDVATLGYDYV